MPWACVRTNASGSAIERSTWVSAAKLTIASIGPARLASASSALATACGILDRSVHEAKAGILGEVVEVLLATGIGELVEHDHLVVVLAQAQAHEIGTDEPRATADQEPHARIIPS